MSEYTMQSTVSRQPPRHICTHFRLFCSHPPRESRVSGYRWRSQLTFKMLPEHAKISILPKPVFQIMKWSEHSTWILRLVVRFPLKWRHFSLEHPFMSRKWMLLHVHSLHFKYQLDKQRYMNTNPYIYIYIYIQIYVYTYTYMCVHI